MVERFKSALLVDGDNISSVFAGQLLRKTKDLGQFCMRLAFCNDHSLGQWSDAPSFRTVHSGTGKNGSDILLSIRAMEYALRDGVQIFAIATSDGDLSHVAHRLRELGCDVVGVGEDKAPKSFRMACTRFIALAAPGAQVEDMVLEPTDKTVREVLKKHDANGNGIPVSRLNELVRKADDNIKISQKDEKTWPRYLSQRPSLYALTGEGKNRRVLIASKTDDA